MKFDFEISRVDHTIGFSLSEIVPSIYFILVGFCYKTGLTVENNPINRNLSCWIELEFMGCFGWEKHVYFQVDTVRKGFKDTIDKKK